MVDEVDVSGRRVRNRDAEGICEMPDIVSDRLVLRTMGATVLRAIAGDDLQTATKELGLALPQEMLGPEAGMTTHFAAMHEENPDFLAWGPRAMATKQDGLVIGHIGFHTTPDPEYLHEFVDEGIELGYTVFAGHRRQGYASEAIKALIGWAYRSQGIENFVISVATGNVPSIALAEKLGFVTIGKYEDPDDGPEHVMRLPMTRLASLLASD